MWTKHYRVMRSELAKCEKARSELEKMHPPHTVQPEQDGQLQDYIQKSDSLYEWRLLIPWVLAYNSPAFRCSSHRFALNAVGTDPLGTVGQHLAG
jgi:hypothetical protein